MYGVQGWEGGYLGGGCCSSAAWRVRGASSGSTRMPKRRAGLRGAFPCGTRHVAGERPASLSSARARAFRASWNLVESDF